VKSVSKTKRKPNWLLRSLICVSFGIHLVIFMHVAGVYQSRTLTFIELTLKDISKPPSRSIPRPRHRPKVSCMPEQVKKLNIHKTVIPALKPMKIEPPERVLPNTLMEQVSMPALPAFEAPKIQKWTPTLSPDKGRPKTADEDASSLASTDISDYDSPHAYFDMVRLKIERHKKYPDVARIRQIEGRATVRFVIGPDGRVTTLKIIKSTRNTALDRAALDAIKKAAPFPKPPNHLFKGSILLEITIAFELT